MSLTEPISTLSMTSQPRRTGAIQRWLNLDHPLPWMLPATLLLAVFGLYPLLYSIWLSLHKWNRSQRAFEFVGLDQWKTVLSDERMWHALGVTCLYSLVCLVLQVVLGLGLALLLDSDKKGFGIVRALVSLPMVVPPAVTGLMFLLMLDGEFGVLSYYGVALGVLHQSVPLLAQSSTAIIGLLLADIWQWTPFMVLLFIAGLRAIPKEPYEAAAVDGANELQQFTHITLPMLGRVFAIAVLIRGIDLFRIYDYVYVMTGGGPGISTETLSYYAGRMFTLGNFPYAATMSLIVLVLVTVLANLVIRIFRVRF
jgi:multiple sugar transport system permease protein